MGFDRLKDLFAQIVLLQQVAECQDGGLIRDPIADQLDSGKAAHCGNLDQGLFHRRIAERIPLLKQVNGQHRRKWVRRPTTFLARFGVVRLDHADECLGRNLCLHLKEELLPFSKLLGRGDLVIRKAKLLATHHPALACDHKAILPRMAWVFQSFPSSANASKHL